MKYSGFIGSQMENIGKSFEKNELAYLALTSKVEFPIRDKLAFNLYQRLISDHIIVAREWRHVDLAILNEQGKPLLICELKAAYTFDTLRKTHGYLEKIKKDFEKSKKNAEEDTEVLAIFLNTHIHQRIDPKYLGIIKYHNGVNGALNKFQDDEAGMIVNVKENIRRDYCAYEMLDGNIDCGSAFGYDVSVYYWIFSIRLECP